MHTTSNMGFCSKDFKLLTNLLLCLEWWASLQLFKPQRPFVQKEGENDHALQRVLGGRRDGQHEGDLQSGMF